jgi:hypothetical protein
VAFAVRRLSPFDVAIIGAGPAGASAALSAAASGWDCVVLEAATHTGGRAREIGTLSNLLGFHSGESLAVAIRNALEGNPRITLLTDSRVDEVERRRGFWALSYSEGSLLAKQLIVATGTRARTAWDCQWLLDPLPIPVLSPENAVDGMVILGNDRVIDASLRQRGLDHVRVLWPGSTARLAVFRRQFPTVDVRCMGSVRLRTAGPYFELQIDGEVSPSEKVLSNELRLAAGQVKNLPTWTGAQSEGSKAHDVEFCGDCEPDAIMRLAVAMGSGAAAASRVAKRLMR